jgi:hypothetical protein
MKDTRGKIGKIALLLETTEANVARLCATDPHFPKPMVESGVEYWWLSEVCRLRNLQWLHGRTRFVC